MEDFYYQIKKEIEKSKYQNQKLPSHSESLKHRFEECHDGWNIRNETQHG